MSVTDPSDALNAKMVTQHEGNRIARKRWSPPSLKNKNQLDATYYFIVLIIGSSSGAHDCNIDYHIGRFVLVLL